MPENNSNKPSIEINISEDKLTATISIIPQENNSADISEDDIIDSLNQKNIVFGTDNKKIKNIVEKYNSEKTRIENEEIARGELPGTGEKGQLKLIVPCIDDKNQLAPLYSSNSKPHITQILKISNRIKKINKGDIVAKREAPKQGKNGTDIFGNPIQSKQIKDSEPDKLGNNVALDPKKELCKSSETGIAVFVDNTIDVYPVNFNANISIKVSNDKMEAIATFYPSGEGGKPLTSNYVKEKLTELAIKKGIDENLISETVAQVNDNNSIIEDIVIAKGAPPQNGQDGKIEYLFNTDYRLKPKELEDGSVNFKDVELIESVSENEELVKLTPPTKGVAGFDIFGTTLQALDGKEVKLPAGSNTCPHPSNPNILIAQKDGNVHLNGNLVEVSEGYVIEGDVDYSTGNINYARSISVKKDVKSGFNLNIGGNLDIGGLVEDSEIKIEGNVLLKGGFLGSGKGIIDAKGCVNLGFCRNQTVKSRADISVAKEAINAKLMARGSIIIYGKNLSAVGGKISARNLIEGFVFGNEQGTKTELEVGIDFTLVEEKYKTEEKIKELVDNKSKIDQNISKFDKIKKIKKNLMPKQEFLYKKLTALKAKIDTQITAVKKRKEMIENKLREVGKAKIIVKTKIMPGTSIIIGDRHMHIQKEIIGPKTIMLVNEEIKVL